MATTANYLLPTPDVTKSPPNVPVDMKALADAIDTILYDRFRNLFAYRTSDGTSMIGTTLQDDVELFINNIPASRRFILFGNIIYSSSTTAKFKNAWSSTGVGASLRWNIGGLASNQTSNTGSPYHGLATLASLTEAAGSEGPLVNSAIRPFGLFYSGTGAGINLKFRWAQFVNDAVNGTQVKQDSFIALIPVG